MSSWRKCTSCGMVLALSEFDDDQHAAAIAQVCRSCHLNPPKPKRPRSSSAASVAAHRERTGNAYGKAYAKARTQANRELAEAHPEEFAELLEKARIDNGLGPTQRA